MENQTTNYSFSEIILYLDKMQDQINAIRNVLNFAVSQDDSFKEQMQIAEHKLKASLLEEMKTHGTTTTEIVDWYWNNNPYEAIYVTTPNGNHPIDYREWVSGRIKNNKEVSPEYFKDYMIRVLDKGGLLQVIPF